MTNISPEREKELEDLEKKLGVSFLSRPILNQSLTHSSYAHEFGGEDNERLEFLGDAILKLVISEYLYHKFPKHTEGELTKIRAVVISDETLAQVARRINLGNYLLLSMQERKSGGSRRKSNIANAFEAVIGAVYLDGGIGKARELARRLLEAEINKVSQRGYIRDYKSALQELTQKEKWLLPHYRVIRETGPKHRKTFWIEVKIKGKRYGIGRGANKKEAEQRAAAEALRKLRSRKNLKWKPF